MIRKKEKGEGKDREREKETDCWRSERLNVFADKILSCGQDFKISYSTESVLIWSWSGSDHAPILVLYLVVQINRSKLVCQNSRLRNICNKLCRFGFAPIWNYLGLEFFCMEIVFFVRVEIVRPKPVSACQFFYQPGGQANGLGPVRWERLNQ